MNLLQRTAGLRPAAASSPPRAWGSPSARPAPAPLRLTEPRSFGFKSRVQFKEEQAAFREPMMTHSTRCRAAGRLVRRFAWMAAVLALQAAAPDPRLSFHALPGLRLELEGPIGERVRANVENWLLQVPQANPGMLEMFRVRDRTPVPQLVPWAGEFVGKYLLSAVQALRLSGDPRLRRQVEEVIREWLATQSPEGYLGPFPKADRLLKHWDLWGHYHALQALVSWHVFSGDAAALAAARKAADLVCATYLDTGRRVYQAGDPEMNMAILTGMAMLHRVTGEPRYLRMAREVEQDWERAGDYLRAGLDGREFFQSPRPRWESLHDLQGLLELWRITGETRYREAFQHHWRSIRRWDRRNTGGFSSGEQATGDPYAPTAIETCCTVAWMALTLDELRLTGDPRAADDLELAMLNGGLGAQHPSGRWWTYNTPMDGAREASAHTIVFQARAGTPELNCCSVNAPRVLGMLGEWAVMSAADGIVLNWLGAGRFVAERPGGQPITLHSSGDAWLTGRTELSVITTDPDPVALKIRIPAWAAEPQARLNGQAVPGVVSAAYLVVQRRWQPADRLALQFEMPLRVVAGARNAAGKVSIYRGPLLLAYDQAQNPFDEEAIPPLDLARLEASRAVAIPEGMAEREAVLRPWLLLDVPTTAPGRIRLVDFASAGAAGTRYRSWLPASPAPPPAALTQLPPDAASVPVGPVLFRWLGAPSPGGGCRVEFSSDETFAPPTTWGTNVAGRSVRLDSGQLQAQTRAADGRCWWRVIALGPSGQTIAEGPPAWFRIDPQAPPQSLPPEPKLGPQGELVVHSLRGDCAPEHGESASAHVAARDADGTELNGVDQKLVYGVPVWPEDDFTVSVRVRIRQLPDKRLGQVFSAWCAVMDDPLRLVIEGGKLFARIEGSGGCSTGGVAVETGRWYVVAAVKRDGLLTLYLDGRAVGACPTAAFSSTRARDCALGGNPHFAGNEFLAAAFADFRFYARALAEDELRSLASASR